MGGGVWGHHAVVTVRSRCNEMKIESERRLASLQLTNETERVERGRIDARGDIHVIIGLVASERSSG